MIEKYEGNTPGGEQLAALGVLPEGWMDTEFNEILAHGWDTFLRANNDPALNRLADVDHTRIFPAPAGSLPDRYEEVEDYENRYRDVVNMAAAGLPPIDSLPGFAQGLRALETLRKELFEDWLEERGLDAIVFPANADVAAQDADINTESADRAWENGVFFSNGNYALRHFGIPSITVAMGIMEDIGMPVGLTIAGPAYADNQLLACGYAFEAAGSLRQSPVLAPPLPVDSFCRAGRAIAEGDLEPLEVTVGAEFDPGIRHEGARLLRISGTVAAPDGSSIRLTVNGEEALAVRDGKQLECRARVGCRRRARGRRLESGGQRRPGGCQRGGTDGPSGRGLRGDLAPGVEQFECLVGALERHERLLAPSRGMKQQFLGAAHDGHRGLGLAGNMAPPVGKHQDDAHLAAPVVRRGTADQIPPQELCVLLVEHARRPAVGGAADVLGVDEVFAQVCRTVEGRQGKR